MQSLPRVFILFLGETNCNPSSVSIQDPLSNQKIDPKRPRISREDYLADKKLLRELALENGSAANRLCLPDNGNIHFG
jgi:hypothetical protein